MEEDYQYRLASQLAVFEKNSKEWEWSDLIKWLSGLKQIIEKYTIPVPIDLIQTLSKRLGQCLSPSLPHGLHSKAFEIYNLLLRTSSFFQISVLSTGLFPHFQFCAPQNKPQYLELIKTNYIERFAETKFLLKGLLASLLEGANETPDTFAKVSEVLEMCESQDRRLTFEVIWWFVLKSQKHRLAGLQYMQRKSDKSTCTQQVECALLEALADESTIARRNALDYIRMNYPIDSGQPGIIKLVQGALKLLKTKDHTVLRRIWEWICPNDFDERQGVIIENIIRPALLEIFVENYQKIKKNLNVDSIKVESIKIIENLCDHDNIGEHILQVVVVDVIEHTLLAELFWIGGKIDVRIKNLVCSKGAELFWNAISERLDHLLDTQEDLALDILKYGKQNFEVQEWFPAKVIKQVLASLPKLTNLNSALEIIISLVEVVNTPELPLDPLVALYKKHVKTRNTEILKKFAILFSKFQKREIQIPRIIKSIKKLIKDDFELGILLAVKFKHVLTNELISDIWEKLDCAKRDTNDLLFEVFSQSKNEWNIATISFILDKEGNLQESPTRKFIQFWDYMNKFRPQQLQQICRNTRIIYTMVDQLSSDDPTSVLLAEEWLYTAKVFIGNIFDPIFRILLHESTTRDVNSDGIYQYNQNFDLQRVEQALKITFATISSGAESLVRQMQKDSVSDYCKAKCAKHSLSINNYLGLLIQLLLLYIQTPKRSRLDQSPSIFHTNISVNSIQDLSSDLLTIVIKHCTADICTSTLTQISELLYKFINIKSQVDLYLLRIIENMFQFNKPAFTYPSTFADCLVLGLHKDRLKIRSIWTKLITQILPIILVSIRPGDLSTYLLSIFENYFEVIKKFKDFSLMSGLSTLVNTCLNINLKDCPVLFNEEGKAVVKKATHRVVQLAFLCYFEGLKDLTVLNELVIPVKSVFLKRFVKAVYELWKKYVCPVAQSRELQVVLMMTPSFQITVEEILEILIRLMEKMKNTLEDLFVANFCQHILSCLEKFRIPVSNSLLWTKVLNILKRLVINEHKEGLIIAINILYTVTKKIPVDLKVAKDVQELVKVIMIEHFSDMVGQTQMAIESVYFGTEVVKESISKKFLKSVHERGFFIFDIVWNMKQDREKNSCYVSFINNLILLLNINVEGCDIICDLIQYFLTNPSTSVSEGVKKNLIEFLKTSFFSFITTHPSTVKIWKLIINRAALTFFTEKSSLLLELMYECEPGLLSPFWSSSALSQNLYSSTCIMCFIIFSSRKGTYSKLLQGITDKIKEILKQEENFKLQKVLMVLCKILYLKLAPTDFAQIRKLVWSNFCCFFLKHLKNISVIYTFEVLKFLDFMLATNFDENCVVGMFLIDVPEFEIVQEHVDGFQPAGMRFLQGFMARPIRAVGDRLTANFIKDKRLILSGRKPESEEDIEIFGKSLIQYASCYSSEYADTDWNSIENDLEKEVVELGWG